MSRDHIASKIYIKMKAKKIMCFGEAASIGTSAVGGRGSCGAAI